MGGLPESVDCLVVGGGPAGLTAAIYLARFHRKVLVIDAEDGRMAKIPLIRNHAGLDEGLPGAVLLERMRRQAAGFGADIRQGEVHAVRRQDGFEAQTSLGRVTARRLLLATGVVNHRPVMKAKVHQDGLASGLIRYCPICDGFEQTGKTIAILGTDIHALNEALFLQCYSSDIWLAFQQEGGFSSEIRARARQAGLHLLDRRVAGIGLADDAAILTLDGGETRRFDALYPALGTTPRTELARGLGMSLTDEGCMPQVDEGPSGVYAAGDILEGLDQISTAMGSAARAAVALHNDLTAQEAKLAVTSR